MVYYLPISNGAWFILMKLGQTKTFERADSARTAGKPKLEYGGLDLGVDIRLLGEVTSIASVRGHSFACDETEHIGGQNKSPRPLEYFLAGVGFCFASILSRSAADMGLSLDSVEIGVRGTTRFYLGIEEVKLLVAITSNEPREKIEELVRLADQRCPAEQTLRKPVNVTSELVLNRKTEAQPRIADDGQDCSDGSCCAI